MDTIIAWASAHPILAWSVVGVAALIVLRVLAHIASWILWEWRLKDRSGANLAAESLTVRHDTATDEVVFIWPVRNIGKYAARSLRIWASLNLEQTNGLKVSWRLNPTMAALEAGQQTLSELRISRHELARLAPDFKKGRIFASSSYSPSSPHKPVRHFGASGPRMQYALSVGTVGGEACVTVTDFTPIDTCPVP